MALKHDMDPLSQQKRKSLYTQKRDIIFKLAEDKDEVKRLPFYERPYFERQEEKISISWARMMSALDLSKMARLRESHAFPLQALMAQ